MSRGNGEDVMLEHREVTLDPSDVYIRFPNSEGYVDHDYCCWCVINGKNSLAKECTVKNGPTKGSKFWVCSCPDVKTTMTSPKNNKEIEIYETSPNNCGYSKWGSNEPTCKKPQKKPIGWATKEYITVDWCDIGSEEKHAGPQIMRGKKIEGSKRRREDDNEDDRIQQKKPRTSEGDIRHLDIAQLFTDFEEKNKAKEKNKETFRIMQQSDVQYRKKTKEKIKKLDKRVKTLEGFFKKEQAKTIKIPETPETPEKPKLKIKVPDIMRGSDSESTEDCFDLITQQDD